jgi:preprotein translocase subunit SecE
MSKNRQEVAGKNATQKSSKQNGRRPNVLIRCASWIKKKFKEMWSELKKVTWPGFAKVVKQTGIVLGVVLVFLVVLTAIDSGLLKLLEIVRGLEK